MTLLEEVAQLLDDLGVGDYKQDGTAGVTITLGALPDGPGVPDECIAVARYGGVESDSRLPYDEPRIQLRVRGTREDARTAETRAQQAYDALHGLGMRELPGGTWLQLCVGVNGGPVYLGRDANGRHEYACNFRCEISRRTTLRP